MQLELCQSVHNELRIDGFTCTPDVEAHTGWWSVKQMRGGSKATSRDLREAKSMT